MRKLFKILFSTIFILFAVLVVGVFVFIKTFDLNSYKSYAEKIVQEQLGRKLSLNGEAYLGLSLVPTVVLEDVEFANPSWAKNSQMVKVKKLDVKFAILPLLNQQIVIDKVILEEPQINLEVAKNGDTSWDFPALDTPQPQQSKKAESGWLISVANATETVASAENSTPDAMLTSIVAKMVQIENGTLVYDDAQSGDKTEVIINHLDLSIPTPDDLITLNVDAVYNGEQIIASGTIGSITEILADKVYPINLQVKAYGMAAKANGNLNNMLSKLTYNLNLQFVNPQGNFGAPEIVFDGLVNGGLDNVKTKISQLSVAGNVMSGELDADISQKVPFIRANLQSSLIDVQKFMPQQQAFVLPNLVSSANAANYIPAEPIPYDVLKTVNAVFDLSVGNLIVDSAFSMQNVVVKGSLKNGILAIKPLNLSFGGGQIMSELNVNANAKSLSLKANSNNLKLQNLHKEFQVMNSSDFGIKSGGDTSLYVNLQSSGNTYRQVFENLKGQTAIVLNKSVIQTGNLSFFTGSFLTQVLDALHLKQKTMDMNVRCAVVRTDFANGRATFPQGIAMNAAQMTLVSDGYVNLVNDKISFTLQPFSGKVVDTNIAQALSSFLRISGTVENPTIRLDDKEALRAVIGVVATGGTAYWGEKLIINPDGSPCYTALQGTPFATMFPKPTGVAATTRDVYKDTEKEIKKSVKDLKNTAKDMWNMFKGGL